MKTTKKKVTLLEQALNEEKRIQTESRRSKSKKAEPWEVLKMLLPNYVPNDIMKAWHKKTQLEKGIKGGVRSGKTYGLAANAIAVSYINRPYVHLSMCPSWGNVIETVVPCLEELCKENGLAYEWLESKGEFKIFHGSSDDETANILFVSGESFFKGLTAASGDCNEPFSIPKKTVLVWRERISHPKAKRREIAWGGTAEPEKMNWGFEYYERDIIETDDIFVTRVPTYVNTHLSKKYISSLEKMYDSKLREVYMEGKHVNLVQLPAYHEFEPERNINRNKKVFEMRQGIRTMILSFDFNVNPMCCAEITKYGKVYIQTAEYKLGNSNTAKMCEYILDSLDMRYSDEEKKRISLIITGDASGRQRKTSAFKTDYAIIKEYFDNSPYVYTLAVPQENPRVRDRVNIVNALMERKKFLIDQSCKYSITDRGLVQWKESAEGFVLDKTKQDRTHMSDACDYGLMIVSRLDNDKSEVEVYEGEQRC